MHQQTQYAVELREANELILRKDKPIYRARKGEIPAIVRAASLCLSDLKLIEQFEKHKGKARIVGDIAAAIECYQAYVPGNMTTVPGHEICVEINGVIHAAQVDYRHATNAAGLNGAIGSCFEGGLQERMLFHRALTEHNGKNYLIQVSDNLSFAATALMEPWTCVYASYDSEERRGPKEGGSLLFVNDVEVSNHRWDGLFNVSSEFFYLKTNSQRSAEIQKSQFQEIQPSTKREFDDIIYVGNNPERIEFLATKLAKGGILNIVSQQEIKTPIPINVGDIHYKGTRIVGTRSNNLMAGYDMIPKSTELQDRANAIFTGAGGGMGQMHVLKAARRGINSIVSTDISTPRLAALKRKVSPFLETNTSYQTFGTTSNDPSYPDANYSYITVLAPVASLISEGVKHAEKNALINIFAGIRNEKEPEKEIAELDLDTIIDNQIFIFGTSGSPLSAMQTIVNEVESGKLDPNVSVDAISGMAGAIKGLRGVANRQFAGKVVVYPELHTMGLIPLNRLEDYKMLDVAKKLENGAWTKAAEDILLQHLLD